MENNIAPIYEINVNGKLTKAVDLYYLKEYLERRKLQTSVMYINPAAIDPHEMLMPWIAKANSDTVLELEIMVDKGLGIYEEPEEMEEEVKKTEVKPEEPKIKEPEVLKTEKPEPKEQELNEDESENEFPIL